MGQTRGHIEMTANIVDIGCICINMFIILVNTIKGYLSIVVIRYFYFWLL